MHSGREWRCEWLKSGAEVGGLEARYLVARDRQFAEYIAAELPQTKLSYVSKSSPLSQGRATYQRDNICRFGGELVGQLFVVGNQVGNIDVAVIMFDENILA